MAFLAIMDATPEFRVAKYQGFSTEPEADAHVFKFLGQYPKAFVTPEPSEPFTHWSIDMDAQTIGIDIPPPPDLDAIDQARIDALLMESGVSRAMAKMMFEIAKAGKTGNWEFFDGVTNLATFGTLLKSLIR